MLRNNNDNNLIFLYFVAYGTLAQIQKYLFIKPIIDNLHFSGSKLF